MSIAVKKMPASSGAAVLAPLLHPYRFTVEQYHLMVELGILNDNDRAELLKGWVVEKMPQNPPHNSSITRINRRLLRVLPEKWVLQVQGPITLSDSEPEPDFAIVRGPEEMYAKRHPTARDVGLIIEIADSSLLADRRWKGALYAQARIPRYWIINLVDKRIEVYAAPRGDTYREMKIHGLDDSVPLVINGRQIATLPVKELIAP